MMFGCGGSSANELVGVKHAVINKAARRQKTGSRSRSRRIGFVSCKVSFLGAFSGLSLVHQDGD